MLTAMALALALGADAPWEGEPFSGDPQAIVRSAASLPAPPAGVELDLLLEDVRVSFDESGRRVQTWRLVWRPLTLASARDWATTSQWYAPWHQSRPEIRVRTVRPDGGVHWLDASTLTDAPGMERRPQIFSDWRMLRGPIPGVEKGVVVEELITVRDTSPPFDAGTVSLVGATRTLPARRWRLRVEAPRSLALRHQEVGLPRPREQTEGGRGVLSWDIAPLEAATSPEPLAPRDRARPRQVTIGTSRSWQEVAHAYAAAADRQLAGADLAAAAREIVPPGDSPAAAARKVLAWIASRIRYTGLELGDAAIVPARPTEVLARRYGDCKDLSLLAVGLLRAAGHSAQLALVRTAWDEVSPDLPGLGVFDHAIVRVGGRNPLWLDPTTPNGEISTEAEGRLALVVGHETAGLTRTPERSASDNRILKVRRILLSEDGWAKAVEETEGAGVFAAQLSVVDQGVNQSEREETARSRLAVPEGNAARVRYEPGQTPGGAPVQVMEAEVSRWGLTKEYDAEAVAGPHPLFWSLPGIFQTEASARGAVERGTPARQLGVLLPMAYQAEVRYQIAPPPGFQAGPLPEGERTSFGPATYQSSFVTGKDGAVTATFRLDVARRQLTPDEFQAMWRGVARLTGEDGPRIRFRRTSQVLLSAGMGREALDEIRRLVALHPGEVSHRLHLALALLALGLGDAARAEARRAADLEPGSEWAWRVVATVLSHDLLGRSLSPGADLEGAIAAQRRARDLSPRAAGTRAWLASLLSIGRDLERFAPGARLEEALAEYRFVHDDLAVRDHDADYALALFHAGRPADALRIARPAPRGAERDGLVLAAVAVTEGPEAALGGAAEWSTDERARAVNHAVRELCRRQRYAEAGRLVEGIGAGTALEKRIRELPPALARIRPLAAQASDRTDPAKLPHRLLQAMGDDHPGTAMNGLLATHLRSQSSPGPSGARIAPVDLKGFGLRSALDIGATLLEVRVEGDGPPWRVHAKAWGNEDSPMLFLATREDGEARFLSAQPLPSEYGAEALRSLQAGDLPAARRLLGWARSALGKADPGAWSAAGALAALWSSGDAAGGEELGRAAAAVAAFGTRGGEGLPLLEREWAASTGGTARRALSFALLHALGKGDGVGVDSALAAAERIGSEFPEIGRAAFQARCLVLTRSGRLAQLLHLTEQRLRARPQDPDARWEHFKAADMMGDLAGVGVAARAMLAAKQPEATDLNAAAWYLLFEAPAEALVPARRAAERPGGARPAVLHTLAAAEALAGSPAAGMAALQRRVGGELDGDDWLVVGLLAERYGAREAAQAAFRRVTMERKATASGVLAKRRLEAIGVDRAP